MGQDGGEFATYGGSMRDTPNRYQKDMRYDVYKKAKRPDPRTGKIPTGKEPLSCHVGRKVNPRDRAIFPKLTVNEGEKRKTYDMIEPEELEFPDGWRWVKSTKEVWNGTPEKIEKRTNGTIVKHSGQNAPITPHKPSPTLVAHMAVDTTCTSIQPMTEQLRLVRPLASNPSPTDFDFSVVSFTSQYRQIGNAVPPLMAKAIAEEITKRA